MKGARNQHPLRLVTRRLHGDDGGGKDLWVFVLRCGHVAVRIKQHRDYEDSPFPARCRCRDCYTLGQRDHDEKPRKGARA